MFGIGTPELIVIIIVGLIVLGPNKLPEIMKSLGKGIAEFRRMSSDVKRTLETEIDRADQERRQEEAKRELFPDGVPEAKPKAGEPTSADAQTAAPATPAASSARPEAKTGEATASPAHASPETAPAGHAEPAGVQAAETTIVRYPHEDAKAEQTGKGTGQPIQGAPDAKGSQA